MKKINLVLAAMLALTFAFTSCAQAKDETKSSGPSQPEGTTSNDPQMKLTDLDDTSWMLGTWEISENIIVDIICDNDSVKSYIEEQKTKLNETYKNAGYPKTTTEDITSATVKTQKNKLKKAIEMMNAGPVETTQDDVKIIETSTVHFSSDKKTVTLITKRELITSVNGMTYTQIYYYVTTYTKKA